MDNLSTEGKDYFIQQAAMLYKLLDQRLLIREFIAGEYSVADMAIYPWTVPHERQYQQLSDYPNLMCWYFDIEERATVEKAYDIPVSLPMPL